MSLLKISSNLEPRRSFACLCEEIQAMFSKLCECEGRCSQGANWYPALIYRMQLGLFLVPRANPRGASRCIGTGASPGDRHPWGVGGVWPCSRCSQKATRPPRTVKAVFFRTTASDTRDAVDFPSLWGLEAILCSTTPDRRGWAYRLICPGD